VSLTLSENLSEYLGFEALSEKDYRGYALPPLSARRKLEFNKAPSATRRLIIKTSIKQHGGIVGNLLSKHCFVVSF
jgi:hypothetical protein